MSFGRALFTVSSLTLVSRIVGFGREVMTAAILGAGVFADAFFVALRLPNLFRQITAEGAFSASFVPSFNSERGKGGDAEAHGFAAEVLRVMIWVLGAFTILMVLAMPWIVLVLAPGFQDNPAKYQLTVGLAQITFPYLMCASLVAFFGGISNSYGKFGPFAAAPILFNLGMMGGLAVAHFTGVLTPLAMAVGLTVSGILQLGWLASNVKRLGINLPLGLPRLTPRVKKLFALMGPGIVGSSTTQILPVFGTIIASTLPSGSISYLYYADRLFQLPIGVIGAAIGTTLLAILAKQVSEGQEDQARHYSNRGIEFALTLGLPSAAALFIASGPIVHVLFERGAFTHADTIATAKALMAYSLALPAIILVRGFNAAYYARKDTVTPLKYSMIAIAIYIVTALLLIGPFKHVGIATALAVSGTTNAALLAQGLWRRGWLRPDAELKRKATRLALCSGIMGLALWLGIEALGAEIANGYGLHHSLTFLSLLVGSGALYLVLGQISGAFDLRELLAMLKKRKESREAARDLSSIEGL